MNANRLESDIKTAQKYLIKGQFTSALECCAKILHLNPKSIDALLVKAIALQKSNNMADASDTLKLIQRLHSNFLPAQLVSIQVFIQTGELLEACKIAESALAKNPQHAALWFDYSNCLFLLGRKKEADEAFKKHLIFSADHSLLRDSLNAFFADDIAKSERLVRSFLQDHPNNVSGMRLLAEIALQLGILTEAQSLLERALTIAPEYHLARLNYAHTLNKRERSELALAQIKYLERVQPNHIPMQIIKAAILVKLGRYQEASELYGDILYRQPNQPELWCSRGHVEKTLGNQPLAIDCYHESISLNRNLGEPYWSLANLKTYRFTEQQIETMEHLLQSDEKISPDDRAHLNFALGKAHEMNQNYHQSFTNYQLGNVIKKQIEPYDRRGIEGLVNRNIAFFEDYRQCSNVITQPVPIFIVGLPRSGSTLIEQILSSHSMIDGTKELPDIMAIARSLGNKRKKDDQDMYPESLKNLTNQALEELGQRYLTGTLPHRGSAPYFLDKMPNNFIHIGLIKTILPNAKIIDARRNPTATCFSCYKQLFAVGQPYTNDLADLRHYYQQYLKLLAFWQRIYPDDIITLQYEDMINDTDASVRRLLQFIDIPYEIDCLNFHTNKRAVATASSEQVRQPINTKGINAWKPYESYIAPILDINSRD